MSNIKEFKVSGTKYGLDLEAIGSYLGNQLLKEYIDSQAGGGSGGGDYVIVTSLADVTTPKEGMVAHINGKGDFVYSEDSWWWKNVNINGFSADEIAAYKSKMMQNISENVVKHNAIVYGNAEGSEFYNASFYSSGDGTGLIGLKQGGGNQAYILTIVIDGEGNLGFGKVYTIDTFPDRGTDGTYALKVEGGEYTWVLINE